MACYNAITEFGLRDCVFKKQREWGGGAVSHPGVGNMGGACNRWVAAAQGLLESAKRGESETTNQIRVWPNRQIPLASWSELWAELEITVVLPTWDCGAITHKEKRKSNSGKAKTYGDTTRLEGGGQPILLLIGWLRFCDHSLLLISLLVEFLRMGRSSCFGVGFNMRWAAVQTGTRRRRRSSRSTLEFLTTTLNLFTPRWTFWWLFSNISRSLCCVAAGGENESQSNSTEVSSNTFCSDFKRVGCEKQHLF